MSGVKVRHVIVGELAWQVSRLWTALMHARAWWWDGR